MKMQVRLALSALFVFSLVACGDEAPTGNNDAGVSDIGPVNDVVETDAPTCNIEPTLASLNENYFSKSCNFSSCHGTGKAGGLDLTGDTHAALVNVPAHASAAAANNQILVVPGDPDASYFVQKLEGPGDAGQLMPLGAQEPMDPDCRIKMVRQWIADGANP